MKKKIEKKNGISTVRTKTPTAQLHIVSTKNTKNCCNTIKPVAECRKCSLSFSMPLMEPQIFSNL